MSLFYHFIVPVFTFIVVFSCWALGGPFLAGLLGFFGLMMIIKLIVNFPVLREELRRWWTMAD